MKNLSIVLVSPEIPQNTGNIIRLCANMGADLHLVKPLGFDLDSKKLRRAHLYYDEFASVKVWDDWDQFFINFSGRNIFAIETSGVRGIYNVEFQPGDVLVFGSESSGLSDKIISDIGLYNNLFLPMTEGSRSMNLANCVSICLYEAWRSIGFTGAVTNNNKFDFASGLPSGFSEVL